MLLFRGQTLIFLRHVWRAGGATGRSPSGAHPAVQGKAGGEGAAAAGEGALGRSFLRRAQRAAGEPGQRRVHACRPVCIRERVVAWGSSQTSGLYQGESIVVGGIAGSLPAESSCMPPASLAKSLLASRKAGNTACSRRAPPKSGTGCRSSPPPPALPRLPVGNVCVRVRRRRRRSGRRSLPGSWRSRKTRGRRRCAWRRSESNPGLFRLFFPCLVCGSLGEGASG